MATEHPNLETTRRYLEAIERGADAAELAEFFDPDVVQEEFPNRLVPTGARRDRQGLLDAHERGKQVVSGQTFEVRNAVVDGDRVALEVFWSATLAAAVGSLPAGGTMRAHFAVFLEFREGKIVAQRNYDCFEPW